MSRFLTGREISQKREKVGKRDEVSSFFFSFLCLMVYLMRRHNYHYAREREEMLLGAIHLKLEGGLEARTEKRGAPIRAVGRKGGSR